ASFKVGAGYIHMRPGKLAGVDFTLQVQVRVWFDAARGPHGGDAVRQIETRSGECHLWHHDWSVKMTPAVEVGPRYVEKVIVHPNDPGHHGVAVQIENGRTLVGRDVSALLDRRNLSTLNHKILIVGCWRSRAIDNPNVGENHLTGVDANKLLYRLRE